jgi:hypothetical protein
MFKMRDFSLDFACPICAAQPNEECELATSAPRFESHMERRWLAQDHIPKWSNEEPPIARETVPASTDAHSAF